MMGTKKILSALIISIVTFYSPDACAQSSDIFGVWRGVFKLMDNTELPFNFEISPNGEVYFLNAEERFESGKVKLSGDSLFIPIDQFDNEMAFKINGNVLTGVLRKQNHSGKPIALSANKSTTRFFRKIMPSGNMSGTYDVIFEKGTADEEVSVGVFKQNGNKLSATFLSINGDARYLEGIVSGKDFYLSSFIGSSPKYYSGHFSVKGDLSGQETGISRKRAFSGIKNDTAALPDVYQLTTLKEGYNTLDFSFPNTEGEMISLKDPKYKNKVVIITIGGTWCPNCIDEAGFLSKWYPENKDRGVEIISLHYERQSDTAFVHRALRRFRQRFNITYDQIFGGIANGDSVLASLQALKTFISFPTTIFIDKKGIADRIHTGYSGPATGRYYDQFIKEFNDEVNKLLNEQ